MYITWPNSECIYRDSRRSNCPRYIRLLIKCITAAIIERFTLQIIHRGTTVLAFILVVFNVHNDKKHEDKG